MESILASNDNIPSITEELIALIKRCLIPNFCKFEKNFHAFLADVPMNSPVSSSMSEVFMDSLERKIFNSDDILLLLGSLRR